MAKLMLANVSAFTFVSAVCNSADLTKAMYDDGLVIKLTFNQLLIEGPGPTSFSMPIVAKDLLDVGMGSLANEKADEYRSTLLDGLSTFESAVHVQKVLTTLTTDVGAPPSTQKAPSMIKLSASKFKFKTLPDLVPGQKNVALGKLPPLKTSKPPVAEVPDQSQKAAQSKWSEFKGNLKKSPMVKLRDATMLYQPVRGTSSGSRYYMVAANSDLRIAARYHPPTLSVRVEGPSWSKHKKRLVEVGFTNASASPDYCSMHLDVSGDAVMAAKVLGSVIVGLGIPIETPVPQISVIAGL